MSRPVPNPGILDIAPYTPGKTPVPEPGRKVFKLSANETPFGPSPKAKEVYQQAASHLEDYPEGTSRVLREAIGRAYGLDPNRIICGAGSDEILNLLAHTYLSQGDEAISTAHGFLVYPIATMANGAKSVVAPEINFTADVDAILARVGPKTKLVWLANPNHPTGALYPDSLLLEIVAIAREHGLIIYADEVYDKVLYDGVTHTALGSLSEDVLTVSFNGLSKNYRSCGYRAGWMVVSGDLSQAKDYIEGLDMLASMRLCANVPGQYGIQTALGGYQSIDDLIAPTGRMCRQRDLAHELITAIPGVTCVKPKAALYMFPRLDPKLYPIKNDQDFIAELLQKERVLLVQGTGFNWPQPDHFRLVFLPHEDDLREAIARIARFLEMYRNRHGN